MANPIERLTLKDWNLCTCCAIGMHPMQIKPEEIKEVKDGWLIYETTDMENENGKFFLESSVQLSNIITLDFIIKSTIISKKKNGKMIIAP